MDSDISILKYFESLLHRRLGERSQTKQQFDSLEDSSLFASFQECELIALLGFDGWMGILEGLIKDDSEENLHVSG